MISFSLRLASRYFVSKSRTKFITWLARFAMLGVALEVMALVVILSVFNGLEDFQTDLFRLYDPDIKIQQKSQQRFTLDAGLMKSIQKVPGVKVVYASLEDQGLLYHQDKQMVVKFKGLGPEFLQAERLKDKVSHGSYFMQHDSISFALVGYGVFTSMGMDFKNIYDPIKAFYPDHSALKTHQISSNALRQGEFFPAGVMEVELGFDDQTVLVPLTWMQDLVGAHQEVNALEVLTSPEASITAVQAQIQSLLQQGNWEVLRLEEQHASLLKSIRIEKFFVFLMMVFIMGMASFTLFYALSLLVIEKRQDLQTMKAMGLQGQQVFRAFWNLGLIIGAIGAFLGMALGIGLVWMQDHFGLVSLGIAHALVDAYPVRLLWSDVLWTGLSVFLITALAAWFPAQKAKNEL